MARDSAEEEKLLSSKSEETEEEEEEEEEALSLCDLPLNEENNQCSNKLEKLEEKATTTTTQMRENVEEFNFGSTEESEMCTADELFFKGQILPLRLSVSGGTGGGPRRCLSRSESMDHGGSSSTGSGSTSINTSRSSSTRSYYSSTTTTTNSANSTTSKQKIRNNFHSFPSPSPQIRVSSFRLSNVSNNSSGSNRTQKSTIWDLFRIGLVRAPEIEFQDLKLRSNNINGVNRNGSVSVSRNSSSGSSSNNSNNSSNGNNQRQRQRQRQKQSSFTTLFNLSGCNCSINAVEAVPLNTNDNNNNDNIVVIKSSEEELKIKKKKKKEERKQMMSRHRTFEWLKELSHGSYVVVNDDGDDRI